MASKRFQMIAAPLEGFNGKLAPASYKCNNLPEGTMSGKKFYYGYRKNYGVARFALRQKSRDLSEHPYSDEEGHIRLLFTQASKAASTALSDPQQRELLQAAFAKQTKYTTLFGFVFHIEYEKLLNG